MPKTAIDYSHTVIYKIVCKDLAVSYVYVGSTTNLIKRRQAHKSSCNNPKARNYSFKVYETIRGNGGWDNWEVVLVESYPDCTSSEEDRKREREW